MGHSVAIKANVLMAIVPFCFKVKTQDLIVFLVVKEVLDVISLLLLEITREMAGV